MVSLYEIVMSSGRFFDNQGWDSNIGEILHVKMFEIAGTELQYQDGTVTIDAFRNIPFSSYYMLRV